MQTVIEYNAWLCSLVNALKFSCDSLEKEFRKLHQGSEGTYFNNVQKVLEKNKIQKARSLLSFNFENIMLRLSHLWATKYV